MNDLLPRIWPVSGYWAVFVLHQTEHFSFQVQVFFLFFFQFLCEQAQISFPGTSHASQRAMLFMQCLCQLLPVRPLPLSSLLSLGGHRSIIICDVLWVGCFDVSLIAQSSQWWSILCAGLLKKHGKEGTKSYRQSLENTYWTYFTFLNLRLTVTCIFNVLIWQVSYTNT